MLTLLIAPVGAVETVKIANGRLTISATTDGVLEIASSGQSGPSVDALEFPWRTTEVKHSDTSHPVWGPGQRLLLVHENGWHSEVALYKHLPFAAITTTVVNRNADELRLSAIEYASWQLGDAPPVEELRAVGTGGLTTIAAADGSYTFHAVADPTTRRGSVAAWLTHEQGIGVFFPSVVEGRANVQSRMDLGSYSVSAGESRPTDTLLLGLFQDVRLGLEAYADAVAEHYRIRLREKPNVYCTWYHAGASNERDLSDNTQFASSRLEPFGLSVIQIDDQWQRLIPRTFEFDGDPDSIQTTGPIKVFADATDEFPSGMQSVAQHIAAQGMTPGIWFMPFAGNFRHPYFDASLFAKTPDGSPFHDDLWSGTCIDLTHPKGQSFVRDRVRRIYQWGYRYFKVDGLHTGLATRNIYVNTKYREQDFGEARLHDPAMTPTQAYRTGLRILREEAPGAYVLGCNVSQNMNSMGPAFGMIDAMRIGPDNNKGAEGLWKHVTLGAWHGTNLYFLNNRVWHNDPDPVYVRRSNPLNKARWMCSWMAVSGALHTSSEQYDQLPEERVDLLKRCLPSHNLHARPVDYLERDKPRIWHVANSRMSVVGLFNWDEHDPVRIECDLASLGLDPQDEYAAFDYWENRFLGTVTEELIHDLAPASCSVLAIREVAEHPQVVSTSRHITQGLIDVEQESWDANTSTLRGTSLVVAADPYQLRIASPGDAQWRIAHARLGDEDMRIVNETRDVTGCFRLEWLPKRTGSVSWNITFQNE